MIHASFESPGAGGALHWKERADGVWHASTMGNDYELTPDRRHFGVWVRPQGGQWQSLGRAPTLGAAFGLARDHADRDAGSQRAAEASPGELSWKFQGDRAGDKVAVGRKGRFAITSTGDGTLLTLDGHAVDTYESVEQAEKVANHLNALHEAPAAAERAPVIHESGNDPRRPLLVHYRIKKEGRDYRIQTKGPGDKRWHSHGAFVKREHAEQYLKDRGVYNMPTPPQAREDYEHVPRDVEAVRKGRKLGAVHSPQEAYAVVGPTLLKESQECFLVLPLDIHGKPLSGKPFEVARGQRDQVRVEPSDILRPVIKTNALGFLVCHNHPSGSCKASEADLELTRTIDEAASKIGLHMLDHLVVGDGEVYSIREGKTYKC